MHELRYKRGGFKEHGEGNEHLECKEVLSLVAWVKDGRKYKAGDDQHIGFEVWLTCALVDRVFVLVA